MTREEKIRSQYRIITNGTKYQVQRRWFWYWENTYSTHRLCTFGSYPPADSLEDAQRAIEKNVSDRLYHEKPWLTTEGHEVKLLTSFATEAIIAVIITVAIAAIIALAIVLSERWV